MNWVYPIRAKYYTIKQGKKTRSLFIDYVMLTLFEIQIKVQLNMSKVLVE